MEEEEKTECLKVRAAQLAASGELAGQLQCLVCHVFASTHEILQVRDTFFLFLACSLTLCCRHTLMARLTRRKLLH